MGVATFVPNNTKTLARLNLSNFYKYNIDLNGLEFLAIFDSHVYARAPCHLPRACGALDSSEPIETFTSAGTTRLSGRLELYILQVIV